MRITLPRVVPATVLAGVALMLSGAVPGTAQPAEKYRQGRLSWALHRVATAAERGASLSAFSGRYVHSGLGVVAVVVELEGGVDALSFRDALRSAGVLVHAVEPDWGWLEMIVPATALRRIAAMPGVGRVRAPYKPRLAAVVSEGVAAMRADEFVARTGADGTGVTVGVMDTSYEGIEALLGDELPADTELASYLTVRLGTFDSPHGSAVAEIVHDVAPGAHLVLEGAPLGVASWSVALTRLSAAGARVITQSFSWPNAYPPDGTSPMSVRIQQIADNGVLFVNSIGNEARNYYSGTWRDLDGNGVMEYPDGTELLPIWVRSGGSYVVVRWDDSPTFATHDYDLYVVTEEFAANPSFEEANPAIVAASLDLQLETTSPFESVDVDVDEDQTLYVVIRHDDATPLNPTQQFYLLAADGVLEHWSSAGTLTIPSDARGALAVGAFRASTGELEWFSSHGPTDDGRIKPDLLAPDGVLTASYGERGFFGTSAAAPHAAGVAALLLSRDPGLDLEGLRAALARATASGGDPALKNNAEGWGPIDLRNVP